MQVDYKGFCKALGVHIKKLRKARGWSNRDILMVHGVNDAQWRKYERGGGLTVESLLRIAAIFGMSIGGFLDGVEGYPAVEFSESAAKKVTKAAKSSAKVAAKRARKSAAVKDGHAQPYARRSK